MNSEFIKSNEEIHKLLIKGFEAHEKSQFDEAIKYCEKIHQINPKVVPAHFLSGLIALASNDHNLALNAFLNTVELDSQHVASWAHLAFIYLTNNEIDQADKALNNVFKIRSDEPLVLDLIGKTLTLMGDHKKATSFFGRAHTLVPNNVEFAYNLANNLIYIGEKKSAIELLRLIVKQVPNSPQPHWSIAFATKATDTSHINEMKKYCGNNQNLISEAFYQYAIGKEYEDLNKWNDAFIAYNAGAKAKRSTQEFDENAEIKSFEFLTQHFNEKWLSESSRGFESSSPIFVIGQPRTGTTLIERIITSHTDVHSAGELQQFTLAVQKLTNIGNSNDPTVLFQKALQLESSTLGALYIDSSRHLSGDKQRFVDKFPPNYLYLPLILKALPNAKIVHLVREPMDACFSSFKQFFVNTYRHSYDQAEAARHHVRYHKLMQHWREQFPNRFFDISYEDTVQDLEVNARRLIDYLELPWQDACLDFHKSNTAVTTASSVQVREPVHNRSIGRWKKYERQLQPMYKILKDNGLA